MGWLGDGLKKMMDHVRDRAIQKQHDKAQEHELKAGKTLRRTKKQMRKARRHERRAETMTQMKDPRKPTPGHDSDRS